MRVVLDIESNNFLHAGIDYSKLPYRLKPDYKVWCVVCRDVDTQDVYRFVGEFEIKNQLRAFLAEVDEIIGHNIIAFDLPVLKLWAGLDYKVGYFDGMDTVEGHACKITDTLVMSKLLYSDTVQGHSLEDWGKRLGEPKGDFHEFDRYSEEMLTYCIQDTAVNSKMFFKFMEEYNRWPWAKAFRMETKLMDLTVAQEHYGFKFFRDRAIAAVEELTVLMAEKKAIVDPLLPPKTLNKGEQKEYIPPKLQFKKDGTPSANMIKFAAKHGWCLENDHGDYHLWISEDNRPELPLPLEPIVKTGVASVEDNDHVKGYLLSLGWVPNAWKERDLTVNSKKQKRTREEYEESVRRYIEQTLEGGYKEARLEILNCSEDTLAAMLLAKDHMKSAVRVPTSPSVTTQDKELCPGLKLLGEKVAFAKDFAEFMTYRHRKNSIAGGLDEDGEASTGFLTAMREDGRIPTPADTNGANTGRYKHRVVCNIPRATSLYGDKMRALFGVSPNKYQLGFDFASLEARIEGHYVYKYPGGPELAAALLLEKPHDIHCYDEETEVLTTDGWKTFGEVTEETLVAQWEDGVISFVKPTEVIWQKYTGRMIKIKSKKLDQLVTPNHRVVVKSYKKGEWEVVTANTLKDFKAARKVPYGGQLLSSFSFNDSYLKLAIAVQADGSFSKDCSAIQLSFIKERKIKRIRSILKESGAAFTEHAYVRDGKTEVCFRLAASPLTQDLRRFLGENKALPWALVNISQAQRELVLEEVAYWDGTIRDNGDVIVETTCKQSMDVLQAIAQVTGLSATRKTYQKETAYGDCTVYRCYIGQSQRALCVKASNVEEVEYSGMIGCVAVPSSFIVVRRNGLVCVSGNTTMAKRLGIARDGAKSVNYAVLYGAGAPKIAKMLGIGLPAAQGIIEAFWEELAPLKALKDKLEEYWKTVGGKKFILGIDGRKIYTRSAHSLVNALFQSGGGLAAKYVAVEIARRNEQAGLLLDPFCHDVESCSGVSQMIVYHDEVQYSVSRDMVRFETFSDEEQAKVAGKPGSSAVGHGRKFYRAYSPMHDTIKASIEHVVKDLKIAVELGFEYQVGLDWYQCH